MSYIKGLIEDLKEIDSLTDEMLELDLPWNERESMLHGDMVDAIDAYLTFLRQYVADGSRYERLQRPSAPRSQSSQCIKKKSASGTGKKKTSGGSKKAQSSQCIKRKTTAKGKTTKSTGSAQRRPTASRRRRCRAGTVTSSPTGL